MTSQHLPNLLPEGIVHVTLGLDAEGRLLAPGAPWAGGEIGSRLDAIAPEFTEFETIAQALQSGEIEDFVKEPVMRVNGSATARTYRLRLRSAQNGAIAVVDPVSSDLVLDIEDISELHALREVIEDLKQQAEIHCATIDMVAHDLNTPLTTLQGYLELAIADLNVADSDVITEYFRVMQGCTERILFTVSEMYDVVSHSTGHLQLSARAVQLTNLLKRVVQENQVITKPRQQSLIVRADPELPAVWCDEVRVLQVFQNLISNASKYSPSHTPITISVEYDQNRADLRFTVSDQGRGIAPSELPFLFERAYRSLNASDQIKGTGLGLYLARLLIELHGGRIWCHSVVGQGSNFHFTLPVIAERHDS